MKFDLTAMFRRTRNPRRREVVLRPIVLPSTLASDLYARAYAPIVKQWEASLPEIVAQYERSLAMTADSPADIGAVLTATEAGVVALYITVKLRIEAWAARLERVHRGKWRGAVLSATGVDISTMVGAGDMRAPIETAIERNVGLVRSVSDQTRTRIGDAVFRGFTRRAPAAEVAKEIRESVAMSRRRALNIAADQQVKLASALNDERRREAGLMAWEWLHSGKLHPREDHKARNGKRYSDDPADKAPPPADRPGELPWCGCTSRAVLSLDPGEF